MSKPPPTEIVLPEDFLHHRITIDLVGAGGNGSQMLYGLARIHMALLAVGHPHGLHVRLYDPDTVTDANVGRQVFSPADVGHLKAIVLVNRVNTFYGLGWEAVGARYSEDSSVAPALIIGCVDSAQSRREIYTRMRKQWDSWWLDLGNGEKSGQVVLGKYSRIINQTAARRDANLERACRPPTVLDLFPHLGNKALREDLTPSCSVAESLNRQDLFINQSVSTFALHLLWTWIRRGRLNHHGYFINLEAGQVSPLRIDPEAWQRIRANSAPAAAAPKKAPRKRRKPKAKAKVRPVSRPRAKLLATMRRKLSAKRRQLAKKPKANTRQRPVRKRPAMKYFPGAIAKARAKAQAKPKTTTANPRKSRNT